VATQSGLGDRTPRSRHLSRTRACGTSCCSPFQNRLADESHSECRWPLLPVPWTRAHPSGVSRLDYDRLLVCPAVQTIARQGSAQNESGGCRLSSEIRHGKICSWCPERASGIRPEQSWPGDEKRTVPTWEWRLERIHLGPLPSPRKATQVATTTCGSPKQARMRDKAKEDARRTSQAAKARSKQAFKNTKRRSHGGDYS